MERRGIECIQQDQKMGQWSSSLDLSYIPTLPVPFTYSRMEIPIIESEIPYPSHATRNTALLSQIPNLHKLC